MATFYNYYDIERLITSTADFDRTSRTIAELPAKIAKAEAEVFSTLDDFKAGAKTLQPLFAKVKQFNDVQAAYNRAKGRRELAEKEYNEWQDKKRLFDKGQYELVEEVKNVPPRPETFDVPAKPELPTQDFQEEFVERAKQLLKLASAVREAITKRDELIAAKVAAESEAELLSVKFSQELYQSSVTIRNYDGNKETERKQIEEELAEIDAKDKENESRRTELKTKLGVLAKLASKLKG